MAASDIILISDSESDGDMGNEYIQNNMNIEDSNTSSTVNKEKSIISESTHDSFSLSSTSNDEHSSDKSNDKYDDISSSDKIVKDDDIISNRTNESISNNIDFVKLSNKEKMVISNGKQPVSQESFYIHPKLKKTFKFEYLRSTNRPGPKSKTRKNLTDREMYFQIFNSGLNPKNGHKISTISKND